MRRHWMFGSLLVCGAAQAQDFVFIANADSGLSAVSRKGVGRVYTATSTSLQGQRVHPLSLASGPLQDAWLGKITGLDPATAKRFVIEQEFRGEGKAPATVSTAATLVSRVAADRSTVGWVPLEMWTGLSDADKAGCVVVSIDGADRL